MPLNRAIHSYTGLYRAIHGYTRLYTAIHSYTQLYRAIHSYTGLYTAIQGYTRLYTAIHGYTQLYTAIQLYQTVPGPTHIAGNKLDFVLCNWPETIENVLTFHPREGIFPTDHYVIEFDIRLKFQRAKRVKRQVFDFKNGNFDDLRESV